MTRIEGRRARGDYWPHIVVGLIVSLAAWSPKVGAAEHEIPYDWGVAGLQQTLRQLQTPLSVLHVVAHPDDEDGALMAYCARGLGMRAMLFSVTRGEGGANLISGDFFDELGALRTLEHLKATSYYGTELFYSHAADYGFSKTLDEALKSWDNGQPILEDLVRVIRRERPWIVFSRFRGDERDGHGHHQLAGLLSRQAFAAAADPNAFPGQLSEEGLRVWQVRKLYANNIHPEWRPQDANEWTVSIPTGAYDPLLGSTYAQVARYGLGFQRSQGISGHLSSAGSRPAYYRLLASAGTTEQAAATRDTAANSREAAVTDQLPLRLATLAENLSNGRGVAAGFSSLARLDTTIDGVIRDFQFQSPHASVDSFVNALTIVEDAQRQVNDSGLAADDREMLADILDRKRRLIERAIQQALGLECEVWSTSAASEGTASEGEPIDYAVPGHDFAVHLRLIQHTDLPVAVRRIGVDVPSGWRVELPQVDGRPLESGLPQSWLCPVTLTDAAEPTRQAWSRSSIAEPFYSIDESPPRHDAMPRPPMTVRLTLELRGRLFHVDRVAEVRTRDPARGQVRYPLTVVPPVSVRFVQARGIWLSDERVYPVEVIVRSDLPLVLDRPSEQTSEGTTGAVRTGRVRLELPEGWQSEPREHQVTLGRAGQESRVMFQLSADETAVAESVTIRAACEFEGHTYRDGFVTITARDLPRLNLFRAARQVIQRVSLQRPNLLDVGYIMGSGDDVPSSLQRLGVSITMLDEPMLESGDLNRFDAIVVGVRAYAVRGDLRRLNPRLLDYVHQGGRLIVQYQTPEFDQNFGPYPYVMSDNPEEVSEEEAAVRILQPQHALFRFPNLITENDFAGWFEQRGSKFWQSWDARYEPLVECHDAGQSPQSGGWLVARYGQGDYIYCAYAWYRQLPYGVPGAYRLMANLLSRESQRVGK